MIQITTHPALQQRLHHTQGIKGLSSNRLDYSILPWLKEENLPEHVGSCRYSLSAPPVPAETLGYGSIQVSASHIPGIGCRPRLSPGEGHWGQIRSPIWVTIHWSPETKDDSSD